MLSVDESFVSFFVILICFPFCRSFLLDWLEILNVILPHSNYYEKKWWYFEHRVIACRSDKVLVSIVWNDLAFLSNLAGCFSHWDRVVDFFLFIFGFRLDFPYFDALKRRHNETYPERAQCRHCSCVWRLKTTRNNNPKNIISSQAFRLFNIICLSLNHIRSRRSYDFLFFLYSNKIFNFMIFIDSKSLWFFLQKWNQLFTLWMHLRTMKVTSSYKIYMLLPPHPNPGALFFDLSRSFLGYLIEVIARIFYTIQWMSMQ